jgi:hypothetical protein
MKLAAEGLKIRWEGLRRRTDKGPVAADLIISVGGIAVKYNVYLSDKIELRFKSTDRSHVELAALLLKLAGVDVEVKKEGGRDKWQIYATTDKLAAGREELRKAIAEIVREAAEGKMIDADKAERWLKKLEEGRVLMEGWPKFEVRLVEGALVVMYRSTDPDNIEQVAQRLREMGLKEGRHFMVEMPDNGKMGYVHILKKGLAHAAWLSVYGSKTQRELAAKFVKLILSRAEEACEGRKEGCAVYEKAKEIVEKGKEVRSQTLKDFKMEVEVNGKKYKVKVKDGEAVEEEQNGKLRIKIKAEVSYAEGEHIVRVEREYTITYSRNNKNAAVGRTYASANAPGGKEADAKILSALIEVLTGRKPGVYQRSDGKIEIKCYEGHLEGFMRYVELADAIEEWLEETSRRAGSSTSQL